MNVLSSVISVAQKHHLFQRISHNPLNHVRHRRHHSEACIYQHSISAQRQLPQMESSLPLIEKAKTLRFSEGQVYDLICRETLANSYEAKPILQVFQFFLLNLVSS